ncbi:MAG TPA: hypothetical protein PLO24_11180 [Bacteroidales bacterium]|jgi:hypothetical protein|nr:hypothetical protein [Bacteroidales bacterium]HOS71173.1 hypothetical protein [Bacteroidales bacterium]HQH23836.1 hypothetical protein [Bacteroidales bacterium]HQJ81661.1 hypothetical protein [Bacteroidales bacterium]
MKKIGLLFLTAILIITVSCSKSDGDTGILEFKGLKAFQETSHKSSEKSARAAFADGPQTHKMHTADMKFDIAEIWVSQDMVEDNIKDNLTWHLIGRNKGIKSCEDYSFSASKLPVGEYKSIKMVFRNRIIRIAVYADNFSKSVEMNSSLDEESEGDDSFITEYFCPNGSFILSGGMIKLMSTGEKISGFTIRSGEKTILSWKLGGPDSKITDCSFDWVDTNGNGQWEWDSDEITNDHCSVEMPMFSFIVEE